MTEDSTVSTVPRRQLGKYLRDLRKQSRLGPRTAADHLEWSEAKIWRIEHGHTSMRALDVEAMCRIYGAPPDATKALTALAKETKARGWWQSHDDVISDDYCVYFGMEEAASRFSGYQSELVPGLLQTEDYARALFRANPRLDEAEIERRVSFRMARQVLLTRVTAPLVLEVVVNEAVLRRPVGGTAVMVRQLERLVEAGSLPTVSIRVAPFDAGLHHGALSGPFVILSFPRKSNGQETEPTTVYHESPAGAVYLDKPREIERYTTAFTGLWESSLDEEASRELMSRVAKELGSEHDRPVDRQVAQE